MLSNLRQAGLVWPTFLTIAALAVLISLGTWQWQRKTWKEGLIKQLAATAKAEPAELATIDFGDRLEELRFRRVVVAGKFADAGRTIAELHLWTPGEGGPGWRVISPFQLQKPVMVENAMRTWGLVIRGRVLEADKATAKRKTPSATGPLEIVGRLRLEEKNWATPAANLQENQWYALDLVAMRTAFQSTETSGRDQVLKSSEALPFFIEAERALSPPPAPQPDLKSIHLRNRHMEYAMTWWGLALTLLAVYLGFVRSRLSRGNNGLGDNS